MDVEEEEASRWLKRAIRLQKAMVRECKRIVRRKEALESRIVQIHEENSSDRQELEATGRRWRKWSEARLEVLNDMFFVTHIANQSRGDFPPSELLQQELCQFENKYRFLLGRNSINWGRETLEG